jgi:hypothetical protein
VTVGFVVCSPAKWSTQALFEALSADRDFRPVFFPCLSDAEMRQPRASRAAAYATTRHYFAGLGPIALDLYDPATDRMHDARNITADVVFIQQPWGMQDLPRQIVQRALPAYVHYGYPVIRNDTMQFGLRAFHPFLWCHFVPDATQARAMAAGGTPQAAHMPVTGHPKLDAYLTPAPDRSNASVWPNSSATHRKRVIFAPHHALAAGSLNLATFAWSGPAMLDLIQTNPQLDFVLKPHPNLAYEMGRGGKELATSFDAVMRGWHDAPNAAVLQGGDYFDLFRSSDAMITDSGSFLAEYLPSGAPLIRLVKDGSAPLNASGEALAPAFYTARDAQTLSQLFESVILQGDDPLAPARKTAIARLMPDDRSSAQRVMAHLRATLRPNL